MSGEVKRSWRYQPVYTDDAVGRCMTLCEVFIDQDGRLDSWTEEPAMVPQGEDIEELTHDLSRMLADAFRWVPVPFNRLRVGMVLQRLISKEEGEALAQFIEATAHNYKAAQAEMPSDETAP